MGKCRFMRCFPLSKLFRRSHLCKKTVIIACVCVLLCAFVVRSSQDRTNTDNSNDKRGHLRGLGGEALPVAVVAPTRPNVVYITLKTKRLKPANIRGTVRPKLRRKKANTGTTLAFTHGRFGTLEHLNANRTERETALRTSRSDVAGLDDKRVEVLDISDSKRDSSSFSSIRIYSQKPPPWFTSADVQAMRFLTDAKVLRVTHQGDQTVLMFEGETEGDGASAGTQQALPAVSRKFQFVHEKQSCPVVLWDASPLSSVHFTWRQYQRSLKHKCWLKNKSESDCSSIHHHEWSRLALFDFLLQIHRRLDPHCCGFRPRLHDECGSSGCNRLEDTELEHLTHREEDPRRLLFTHNRGFFDRNEDNLDFRLLEGITVLPAGPVEVLRSGRLREKLLQSLFIDQTFWETQGGRQGIDKLIGVLEKRAKVLLTYITAHGLSLTPMNS
ncbi:hypothetical protein WMY93_009545 [Mugilogobius chulae]|uniref:Golgi associated kinase 1B n=1 Tax=Mugilogobius chulae TaxID=88201 RepID=A0AAW0PF54_9GOBI